jgi:hypothetical protein
MTWTETGEKHELCEIDDEKYEVQEVNQFGRVRWVESECEMIWEDTGETREIVQVIEEDPPADPPNPPTFETEDEIFEKQQVNNLGRFRWIEASIPMSWSATGKYETTKGVLQFQKVNQFGRYIWLPVAESYIAPVCCQPAVNLDLEREIVSSSVSDPTIDTVQAVRTVQVAVTIEKGYGFIAGDTADPDADVLVPHPVTGAVDYVAIYPTPRPEATVEVYDTLAVGARVLLGYARNNPLGLT